MLMRHHAAVDLHALFHCRICSSPLVARLLVHLHECTAVSCQEVNKPFAAQKFAHSALQSKARLSQLDERRLQYFPMKNRT